MKFLLVLVLTLLAGCKPPKFNQKIDCPTFHAVNVAIYLYQYENAYLVLYPNLNRVVVDRTECVIETVK